MKEIAKVKSLYGNNAIVTIDKKDACSKCGLCVFPKNASEIEVFASNSVKAKEGDLVMVDRKEDGKFLASVLVFLVPILLILLSTALAYLVMEKEIWTLYFSLIFIVLWYLSLYFIDKRLKKSKKFATEIIQIINEKNKENENEQSNRDND